MLAGWLVQEGTSCYGVAASCRQASSWQKGRPTLNTHSPIVHTDCHLLTSSEGCGKLLAICQLSGLQQLPG